MTRPHPASKQLTQAQIEGIFKIWAALNPHPETELEYTNPFTLLVAVVLSAQATDVGVNKATKDLFPKVDTPQKMLKLGEEGLKKYVRTIGLYRSKARHIIGLSAKLVAEYGGQVPNDQKALESLPGVGRKTANVVRNVVFGEPTMAVDTHIFRISNRIGLAPGKTPLEVEKKLLRKIPPRYRQHAHHWLILHGRYICVARKPKCAICPIQHLCNYPAKDV